MAALRKSLNIILLLMLYSLAHPCITINNCSEKEKSGMSTGAGKKPLNS
jgi:hypothetical protein